MFPSGIPGYVRYSQEDNFGVSGLLTMSNRQDKSFDGLVSLDYSVCF
jgi:hypothetical protein